MIITVRGTDSNDNKAAHITALLAGLNASNKSRKTLILQFCKNVPIEDLLIGKKIQETDIMEGGFMFDDNGIDALFRRIETQRIMKEHFDACCTPILNAENLLDVATSSTKENFEAEIVNRPDDIESLIKQSQDIYDDIFIYANSKNKELLEVINQHTEVSIICIRQGNKEEISCVTEKSLYLVTSYDKNSSYSLRFIKNMYKLKNIKELPYIAEMKDSYNAGRMMQFIGKNEKISESDINYPLFHAANSIFDTYIENKQEEYKEEKKLEPLENTVPETEQEEFKEPQVVVTEKKRFFSKKKRKIVTPAPEEEGTGISEDVIEDEVEEIEDNTDINEEKPMIKAEMRKKAKEEKRIIREKKKAESKKGKDADTETKEETLGENQWKCPECGEICERNFCLECGCKKPKPVVKEENNNDWICPDCDETNPAKAKFCLECGCKKPEPEPEPEEVLEEIIEDEFAEWTCPECDEMNPAKAKFCLECGCKKPESEPEPEPTEWTCPECGEVNPIKAKFCLECGCKK